MIWDGMWLTAVVCAAVGTAVAERTVRCWLKFRGTSAPRHAGRTRRVITDCDGLGLKAAGRSSTSAVAE